MSFMLAAGANPLFSVLNALLHYTQLLANSFKSVLSIKNYLSGAKTFVTNAGGDPSPFASQSLNLLIRGITRLSPHIPSPAPALDLASVKKLCDTLWLMGPDARISRAAVLFGFTTFLRQSNFLVTPNSTCHLLRRSSVRRAAYGLAVHVASTKTLLGLVPVVLPIHRVPNSRYCPVAAYLAAKAATPAHDSAPLFITTTGRSLTTQGLTALIRAALAALRHPAAATVTVHSLRRSGACCAAEGGVDRVSIMTHAIWQGASVDSYVPRALYTSVPKTLATLLGTGPLAR